jgi:NhaP-type Na+/H+ or K+/H+ antiporter
LSIAPIIFTLAGIMKIPLLAAVLRGEVNANVFLRLVEIGLVLLLLSDTSRTDLTVMRSIADLPPRLLSVGMLLTILLGAFPAWLVFPYLSVWEAAFARLSTH